MSSPSITVSSAISGAREIDAERAVKSLPLRESQSDAAVRLQPERAIAIEFEFVRPDGVFQELATASLSIGSTNSTLTLSVFMFGA
jgi:hypothetical protein